MDDREEDNNLDRLIYIGVFNLHWYPDREVLIYVEGWGGGGSNLYRGNGYGRINLF